MSRWLIGLAVRATCVPAGEHTVVWRYQPRSYAIGGILSLLALVLVGTAVWRMRKIK